MVSNLLNKIDQLNIELAGNCNLKCKMCTQASGREADFLSKLPVDLFYKAVDEALPLGLKYVTLGGSGEPTIYQGLDKLIRYLSDNNVETLMYTNAVALKEDKFRKYCESGLGVLKISAQGWDRESYKEWMSIDAYDKMRDKISRFQDIIAKNNYEILIQTNHLIHDSNMLEFQKDQYIKNWVEYLGIQAEIWIDHNWSGAYEQETIKRKDKYTDRKKRSCGRPLSNIIEIRAGGLNGKHGAVVPCPNVLGVDSLAVMGHLQDSSLMEIVNGEMMNSLRESHVNETFDTEYCKNCDQLLDIPESLVWTNIEERNYGESRVSGMKLVLDQQIVENKKVNSAIDINTKFA